jgi:hypothetical protein
MQPIYKYPRTYHLHGSKITDSPSDKNLTEVSLTDIGDRDIVIEEKVDGANVALSFANDGQILLQSRGNYLTGGSREKHFNLFKQWAYSLAGKLQPILGTRYVLYGEWLYAKHTIFYNYLPHYFLEYDILDLDRQEFLSTPRRQQLLRELPIIAVPVLYSGKLTQQKLNNFIRQSKYIKNNHLQELQTVCQQLNLNTTRAIAQTDNSNLMEGLYIKVEENGIVKERYKYIRAGFLTAIENSGGHWLNRPIIPNQLQKNVNLFKDIE